LERKERKDGKVDIGDRIVPLNGNMIEDSKDLKREILRNHDQVLVQK